MEANAQLIAAAPELFYALGEILKEHFGDIEELRAYLGRYKADAKHGWHAMLAALDKATALQDAIAPSGDTKQPA